MSWEPDEVETVLKGKVIDGWTMENSLGSGANGIVLMCKKGSAKAVLKLALSSYAAASLEWESLVMDRITMELAYVIMECLPGNPVPIIGNLQGEEQTLKIIEYGLQLLKAIYDMHQCGFIHRDIKPENIGMYD
ncbi:hypothetical protein COOONC_12045, partial [Cooperia oncophora]